MTRMGRGTSRDIFERFAYSGTGEMFEYGHPLFLAGMCGSDLARRVLEAGQGPTRSTSSPATARNTGPAGEGVEEEAGVRGKTTNLNRREDA